MSKSFDSKYEERIWDANSGKSMSYHTDSFTYTVEYTGNPDFTIPLPSGGFILVEAKGDPRHFTSDKRKRLAELNKQLPKDYELRMLIEKPGIKLCDRKTMRIEDWAESQKIQYAFGDKIPESWFDVVKTQTSKRKTSRKIEKIKK